MATKHGTIPPPLKRNLRGYSIDPSLSIKLSTKQVSQIVYSCDWEDLKTRKDGTGSVPVGEYIEIVDYDPATGEFYEPVNLDHPHALAQDGLEPSVSNPQFHQQMVYAVMMTTIRNFESALGRKIQWAENIHREDAEPGERPEYRFEFVQRLRVYPHALRQANAFYDPHKKAILFGYFRSESPSPELQLPGSTVFTCLSHDIIAHETTHAILDGFHRRYIEATHPDTRAFHEAFADIVALFQHFTFPEVLKHQIALTRGDLFQQNILGQLAQEFGKGIGGYGSLRDAIGELDENKKWRQREPDPNEYATEMQFHKRGGILVAAIFDAFLNIYQQRVRRVLRIATGGTGILPDGEIHPDLVDELAEAAAKTADEVLRICIRALDYCPPMDITFGDYLRAILTADYDHSPQDSRGYRVAFIEAFQKRGIAPQGVRSMAVEELLHEKWPHKLTEDLEWAEAQVAEFLTALQESVAYVTNRPELYEAVKESVYGRSSEDTSRATSARKAQAESTQDRLHSLLEHEFAGDEQRQAFEDLTGLKFPGDKQQTESLGLEHGHLARDVACYAIGNVWLSRRPAVDGSIANHVILTIVQKRGVSFEVDGDNVAVGGYFLPNEAGPENRPEPHIIFKGGCTLVFDLEEQRLRYAIKKDIDDHDRMIRQYRYQCGMMGDTGVTYFDHDQMNALAGPFAFMHSHDPEEH